MSEIRDIFAVNVRRYRRARGLSQEKLAELAGLHRTYIGGIEQRRVNVSLKNVGKIAAALNVNPALLFLLPSSNDPKGNAQSEDIEADAVRPFGKLNGSANIPSRQSAPDYALLAWDDRSATITPIEVAYGDLTVQILCSLIQDGYRQNELAERYESVHDEVVSFLRG